MPCLQLVGLLPPLLLLLPGSAATRPAAAAASSGPGVLLLPTPVSCCLAGMRTGCQAVQTEPCVLPYGASEVHCEDVAAVRWGLAPSCS